MKEIKKKIDSIELMKWVVLPSFILTFFVGFGGQGIPQNIYSQSIIYSVESNQSVSEKIHNSDLSSFCIVFGDFEIEIEAEDEDNRHYSNRKSSQPLSLPLVLNKITGVSLSHSKRIIKLFILFHSWKSFLHI